MLALAVAGCVDNPVVAPREEPTLSDHPHVGEVGEVSVRMRVLSDEAFDRASEVSPQYELLEDRTVDVRVFEPEGEPEGVVAFAFANNDTHCSLVERYDTLGRSWASRGVVVVIPDSGELNCQKGTRRNIHDRAVDVLAAAEQAHDWYGDDLPVVFAGHSRGGGAALLAGRRTNAAGVITLQGVDLVAYGWGASMPDAPLLGITASNDTDLNFPYTDATEDRTPGRYTWATVLGGIHAYTTDSLGLRRKDEPEVTRAEQLGVVQLYTNAFLGEVFDLQTVEEPANTLRAWDGADELNGLAGAPITSVRWHDPARDLLLIDDFDGPVRTDDPPDVNLLGGANTIEGDVEAVEQNTYKLEDRTTGIYANSQALVLRGEGVFWSSVAGGDDEEEGDGDEGENFDPYRVTFRARCPDDCDFDVVVESEGETLEFAGEELDGYEYRSPHYAQILTPVLRASPGRIGIRNYGPTVVVDDLRLTRPRQ